MGVPAVATPTGISVRTWTMSRPATEEPLRLNLVRFSAGRVGHPILSRVVVAGRVGAQANRACTRWAGAQLCAVPLAETRWPGRWRRGWRGSAQRVQQHEVMDGAVVAHGRHRDTGGAQLGRVGLALVA